MSWGTDAKTFKKVREIFPKDPKAAYALLNKYVVSAQKVNAASQNFANKLKYVATAARFGVHDFNPKNNTIEYLDEIIREIEEAKDAYLELSMAMSTLNQEVDKS